MAVAVDDEVMNIDELLGADGKGRIPLNKLTTMMLKGQNNLVIQYLRALPKDECALTRTNLIKSLEQIQKARSENGEPAVSIPSSSALTSSPAPSSLTPTHGTPTQIVIQTDVKKRRGSTSGNATGTSSSGSKKDPRKSKNYSDDKSGGSLGRSAGQSVATSVTPPAAKGDDRKNRFKTPSKSAADADGQRRSPSPTEAPSAIPDNVTHPSSGGSSSSSANSTPQGSGTFSSGIPKIEGELILGLYRFEEEIGKGMFGVVHRAINVQTGQIVAVKEVNVDQVDPAKLPNIMREADVLSKLDHPNIVKIFQVHKSKKKIYFILEYIDSGSFLRLIKKHGFLPEDMLAIYTREILNGLKYLHGQNIVHRDIKAGNVLLNKEGGLKLIDFGTAKPEDTNKNFTVVGTPYWMAPEIIEMEGGGVASDIWSLGCTILELLTGVPPYFDLTTMQALFNIVEDKHPPIPDSCSPALKHFLVNGCFVKDPKRRPSASDLLTHPWIDAVKNKPHPTYETLCKSIKDAPINNLPNGKNTPVRTGSGSSERGDKPADKPARSFAGLVTGEVRPIEKKDSSKDIKAPKSGDLRESRDSGKEAKDSTVKDSSKERDGAAAGAGDTKAPSRVTSPRVANLTASLDSAPGSRSRSSSSASIERPVSSDVTELQSQVKKVTKERDTYKKENEELKKQLEAAQRELAQLKQSLAK